MSITWQDARDDSEWRSGWIAVAWTLALAIGEALGKRWGWISRRNDNENTGRVAARRAWELAQEESDIAASISFLRGLLNGCGIAGLLLVVVVARLKGWL